MLSCLRTVVGKGYWRINGLSTGWRMSSKCHGGRPIVTAPIPSHEAPMHAVCTRGLAALIATTLIAGPAAADDIQARYYYSDDTLLSIGQFTFEGGKTLNLTVGIGSGALRGPNDPPNVIWTVGDRGPNIACDEMKGIAGIEFAPCKGVQNGRVYPTPVLCAVDLPRDAAGRWDLPRHRRHHAEGPRRPPALRHAQSAARPRRPRTPWTARGKPIPRGRPWHRCRRHRAARRRHVLDRRRERPSRSRISPPTAA